MAVGASGGPQMPRPLLVLRGAALIDAEKRAAGCSAGQDVGSIHPLVDRADQAHPVHGRLELGGIHRVTKRTGKASPIDDGVRTVEEPSH